MELEEKGGMILLPGLTLRRSDVPWAFPQFSRPKPRTSGRGRGAQRANEPQRPQPSQHPVLVPGPMGVLGTSALLLGTVFFFFPGSFFGLRKRDRSLRVAVG